ncbi:MAG: excinuclease ABC subunit UvrA [Dethiobacteria bacterium]
MNGKKIIIRGAREHNLKNIDLDLPRNRLIVFTGVSGSGKSSLAFDTIYAEGQRRYVESLSAYARQFLGQLNKPDVDLLEGLSPSISIDQKATTRNPRSTVGTVTEIYDFMRLLYARIGKPHCPHCRKPITQQTVEQIVDQLLYHLEEGTRLQILAPLVRSKKGEYTQLLEDVRRKGYVRVRIDGEVKDLEDDIVLDKNRRHTIEVVVDRIVLRKGIETRLADSLETTLKLSEGLVKVQVVEGEETLYHEKFACVDCGFSFEEISPRVFSFNSPYGACPDCSGLGVKMEFDPRKVVPNGELTIAEGALHPWNWGSRYYSRFMEAAMHHFNIDEHTPFNLLSDTEKEIIFYGAKEPVSFRYVNTYGRTRNFRRAFPGILNILSSRYRETTSEEIRDELNQYMSTHPCPRCRGRRLKESSLAVTINGKNISEVAAYAVNEADAFFNSLALNDREMKIARQILKEITARLNFLCNVGLDYLNLDRAAGTLSGGEAQRIRLATQIGSGLTGVIYILDEPSIGLHQRDNLRLLQTLMDLRDLDNTVIVVEHDEETIRKADYIVDIGPGAGAGGGEIVAAGPLDRIMAAPRSITGDYLAGRSCIEVPGSRRGMDGRWLTVEGARAHNLKDIDVRIPLGVFTCVTGVSGSGKSTLINDILARELARCLHRARERGAEHDKISGLEHLDKVVEIDQSPIGRTPRSNPATYTGLFDGIRELFSQTPESRMRGYRPGRFSFNVKGGRCESCRGDGILKIEMHFLPDVYVPCEVCRGKRYNRETLEIRFKDYNIADVLNLTVEEALAVFKTIPRVQRRLQSLDDVGLGYIRLGQPATTLSGGEAQRVKLATELSRRSNGRTIYILDEPTTGLHIDDICKLLAVLEKLVDSGNTVVVIEHNMEVIKRADYLIDLGPEGGAEGGEIVAEGTPEEVANLPHSYTGRYLRRVLYPEKSPAQG